MGKSKGRKGKKNRPRPTSVPSVKEIEEEDELNGCGVDVNTVYSVLEKIQSASSEDKECGATIIARMSEDEEFVAQFIDNDGLRMLAPLLVHSNISVRHTVCGSLRNLSTCGSHNISEEMVKQDVLTPLIALLKQYSMDWTPLAKVSCKSKIDSKKEIFIEAVHLLSSLCESSDIALESFNSNHLISILLPCLNMETYGMDVALPIVECLHTVTEDNGDAIERINQPERQMLFSFVSLDTKGPEYTYLRILSSGVLLNLNHGKIDECSPSVASAIMDVLDDAMQFNVQSLIEEVAGKIGSYKEFKTQKYCDSEELEAILSAIVIELNIFQSILTSKKIALEILTNICCVDDGEADGDWDEISSASDEMIDPDDVSSTLNYGLDLPCEVHGVIINKEMVRKVLDQIVIPKSEIAALYKEVPEGRECIKRLHTVTCRALFCINNMVQGLNIEELGGSPKLFELWMDLSVLVFSQTDPSDIEQLQAATSSVRAVIQKLAETNSAAHFGKMTENDLALFFNMWHKCQDASVRVNILRSIATVACILVDMKQPNAGAVIKTIGSYLIDGCTKTTELWVAAEALDAIFDVFSEDHLDSIACEINLVEKLKSLLPLLKGKVKQQRNTLGEHFPVVMTAKSNLIRFLKYKERG